MTSSTEAPAQRVEKKSPTLIGFLLKLPFTLIWIVIVSIISSILIEWVGIWFGWWSLPGSAHAQMSMESEMGYLNTTFTRSVLVSSPVQFATRIVQDAYYWAFDWTGIADWVGSIKGSDSFFAGIQVYLEAAIYVTLMTLTRCVILILTSPLFVMAGLVGLVDGLVRRDLRRFGAGMESAFIYHHFKRLVSPIFVTGWLIYLSLPFSINPNLFLLPCALLFGLMISVTTGSFKKYL